MDPENEKADEVEKDEKPSNPTRDSKPVEAIFPARKQQGSSAGRNAPRPEVNEAAFTRFSRRELLKVAPVVLLGAFAVPSLQEALLKKGLGFSDWASKQLFRRGHLAPTFRDAELTPFEKFPINDYDVDDPGVN